MEAEVRRLYVPGVFGKRKVAKALGCSPTTVDRLLHPEKAERSRQKSNEAKRRRTGICGRCGGPTRYNGHVTATSRVCASCAAEIGRESKVWTREAVIEAIQHWAELHGRPPSTTEWIRAGENHPAMSNVYVNAKGRNNPFPTWADAIEAAGFERPELGGRYRERPEKWKFDHAEAMRLLGEGVSRAEVARRMGVAYNTIHSLEQRGGSFAQSRPK